MRETTTADAHKLCSCTRVLRPSDAYLFIGKLRVKRGESIEVKGRESHRGKPCCPCRRSVRDDESDLEESGDKVPSSDGTGPSSAWLVGIHFIVCERDTPSPLLTVMT